MALAFKLARPSRNTKSVEPRDRKMRPDDAMIGAAATNLALNLADHQATTLGKREDRHAPIARRSEESPHARNPGLSEPGA